MFFPKKKKKTQTTTTIRTHVSINGVCLKLAYANTFMPSIFMVIDHTRTSGAEKQIKRRETKNNNKIYFVCVCFFNINFCFHFNGKKIAQMQCNNFCSSLFSAAAVVVSFFLQRTCLLFIITNI